jgi:hypothetical protein
VPHELKRCLALILFIALVPCALPAKSPGGDTIPSDAELASSGAVIGEILIDNQNIFDESDPQDNTKLFRLANRLHIRTRERVVRDQLLFRTGDRFSRHVLDESERILRSDRYFYDAWITPVSYHDGQVDLRVTTRDVWTLNPGISFGRRGGKNTSGIEIEELNVLGTGSGISLSHKSGIDRDETQIQLSDQHAFGTWTSVKAKFSDNSDGSHRELFIDHPFYALDVRRAGGIGANDHDRIDSLYDRGQVVDQFREHRRFAEGYFGWSSGLDSGWVRRWRVGATYDERHFDTARTWTGISLIPQDRKFFYPWIRLDLIQDDYEKLRNRDQIEKTEDFYLGATASVRVGWANSTFGSSRSAMLFRSAVGDGFAPSARSTLLFATTFNGRLESGELRNAVLDSTLRYYAKQSRSWLFFTALEAATGRNLDLDSQILLGGDSGLRGYPLRYQGGNSRALLTVEQRYFTDWYPFRLLRVGAAVFFDAGRTWGTAPLATPSLGLLKDAGFGLRFGNSRSGLGNVIHVDVAFPLDGDTSIKKVQFLVETKESF